MVFSDMSTNRLAIHDGKCSAWEQVPIIIIESTAKRNSIHDVTPSDYLAVLVSGYFPP